MARDSYSVKPSGRVRTGMRPKGLRARWAGDWCGLRVIEGEWKGVGGGEGWWGCAGD
jgi:hypothetical protein